MNAKAWYELTKRIEECELEREARRETLRTALGILGGGVVVALGLGALLVFVYATSVQTSAENDFVGVSMQER